LLKKSPLHLGDHNDIMEQGCVRRFLELEKVECSADYDYGNYRFNYNGEHYGIGIFRDSAVDCGFFILN